MFATLFRTLRVNKDLHYYMYCIFIDSQLFLGSGQ